MWKLAESFALMSESYMTGVSDTTKSSPKVRDGETVSDIFWVQPNQWLAVIFLYEPPHWADGEAYWEHQCRSSKTPYFTLLDLLLGSTL